MTLLTADGCRKRRERFWRNLDPRPDGDHLRLADPIHLMYLANFHVDPFSLGAGFRGYLLVRADGHAKLIHDNRLPQSVEEAVSHLEKSEVIRDAMGPMLFGPFLAVRRAEAEAFAGQDPDEIVAAHRWRY